MRGLLGPKRRRQDDAAAPAVRPRGGRRGRASSCSNARSALPDSINLDGVAGFVEEPTFYPYLPGRVNLELFAELDGGADAGRVDEVLEQVGLAGRGGDRVSGYSTGMRQRLGIAAALLRSPRLLLLDEPTSGLDPAGARDMGGLVRRLAAEGTAVLLSSHLIGGPRERVRLVHGAPPRQGGVERERRSSCASRRRVRPTGCAPATTLARSRSPSSIRHPRDPVADRRAPARGAGPRRCVRARPRASRCRGAPARAGREPARVDVLRADRATSSSTHAGLAELAEAALAGT